MSWATGACTGRAEQCGVARARWTRPTAPALHRAAPTPPEESEANEFAAALLMPAHLVRRHYERLRRRDPEGCFQQLCRIFGVSGAAMSRRLRSVATSP